MADVIEKLYATGIRIVDQNGTETVVRSGNARIEFNCDIKDDVYASKTYKLAYPIYPVPTTYASTKKRSVNKKNIRLVNGSFSVTAYIWSTDGEWVVYTPTFPNNVPPSAYVMGEDYSPYCFFNTYIPDNVTSINNTDFEIASNRYGVGITQLGSSGNKFAGLRYVGSSYVNVNVEDSFVEYLWQDIIPVISGQVPSNGAFVNEKTSNTFSWSKTIEPAADGTILSDTTVFKWRVHGETEEHTITPTGNSVTIPANTLPTNGQFDWCVISTTSEGNANTPNWITNTTTDATPDKPTNLYPVSMSIDGNESNMFRWEHNVSTGSIQSGAVLEYSTNGSSYTQFAIVYDSSQSVSVPGGTIPNGMIYWRVKTSNTDGTYSAYSDPAQIIVHASPSKPIITDITSNPRSKVTWTHNDQVGYRVVFEDSEGNKTDTGKCYGSIKEFTSPIYLRDGSATATIYVANSSDQWAESSLSFVVINPASGNIGLGVENGLLNWNGTQCDLYYILRDGYPIAKTTSKSYFDKASTTCSYQILGVVDNGYILSDVVEYIEKIPTAIVYDYENDGELISLNIKQGNPVSFSKTRSENISYVFYSGRKYPIGYTGGYNSLVFNIEVTTMDEIETSKLRSLLGKLCLIKDKTGERIFAICDSVSENVERFNDVSLSFTAVDYSEVIQYD